MANQTTTITLAGWVLMILPVGAIGLVVIWLLVRMWRRHDRRHQNKHKRRRVNTDIWQASGDRLGPPIITQHDDNDNLSNDSLDDDEPDDDEPDDDLSQPYS